ncbi:Plant-drug/metabolite exporter [Parasponia andersonii]|uniref:WAT1-related protein n=1 Tax=Parasponia andersonii TaxID=3476 RepID=A0A2P5DE27_PARAD|nr:Plant-drug/metabolite exporter [Parasponia andersonii]
MADSGGRRLCQVPERAQVHMAATLFQLGHAGNHVLLRAALNMGVSKLVFPFYRNMIAFFALLPFAYILEKRDRPPLNFSFLIQVFLHGLVGITSNQLLYLLGMEKTSPTFASAMDNAIPAVTFLMATIFRLEQVHLNRKAGIAKVLGTLASVAGATVITLYRGPAIYKPTLQIHQSLSMSSSLGDDDQEKNWALGCMILICRCLCWSSWFVLQAPLLKKYPARLSVTSFTCFFSILQFFVISISFERDFQAWQVRSSSEIFILLYSGLVASGMAFAIQIWVTDKSGPVFVPLYMPLQTLLVAILASIVLGEEFHLGSIIGAVLVAAGLYFVVWGKNEESKFARENMKLPSISENDKYSLIKSKRRHHEGSRLYVSIGMGKLN